MHPEPCFSVAEVRVVRCRGRPSHTSSVQFAPFIPIFGTGRLNGVWADCLQILVRKILSMAGIQLALCGYRNCQLRPQGPHVRRGRSREALPPLRLTPPNCTHLYGVKCTRRVDSQTQHGLPRIHPKWVVLWNLDDGIGQRVSPLMSPFARTKPKVLTVCVIKCCN